MKRNLFRIILASSFYAAIALGVITPLGAFADEGNPLKHISLSDDGEAYVDFGGQLRLRYENWNNFGTSAANRDESLLLTRILIHSDIHLSDNLRLFIEGKSALSTTNLRPPLDRDELALQQAFADITLDDSLSVRVGRQEFAFGKQRLVSPLDWSNTRRTWDGVRVDTQLGDWDVAGFWAQFVPVKNYDFNEADAHEQFYGAYATGPGILGGKGMDVYYLGRDRKSVADERHSFGARLFGNISDSPIDYDLEGTYQFGELNGLDISAYSIATQIGYSFQDTSGAPRVFLGFDYASGDDDPTDGDSETFDQIRPLGHAYFGFIDLIGRQNIMDFSAGLSMKPVDKVTLILTGHLFELAEDSDVLYNAGGAPLGAATSANDEEVGAEIDILAKIAWDEQTTILLGYSHFFAGDYFDLAGNGEDIDFLYAQWQYNF